MSAISTVVVDVDTAEGGGDKRGKKPQTRTTRRTSMRMRTRTRTTTWDWEVH
jgi:hypothetical protein